MLLKPKMQIEKITDISIQFLKENNIKALILDADNTLITLDKEPLEGVQEWINKMKKNGIKLCIASNSIKRKKVEKLSKYLEIPYTYFSIKPTKIGLKRAKKILQIKNNEEIAEIGDQLFTDVLGANRMKMFSILTKPISEEKVKLNNLKRKLEKKILNKQAKK